MRLHRRGAPPNPNLLRRAIALLLPFAFSTSAAASVLQVDHTLNCPDPGSCYLTINAAMAAAVAGDTVQVRDGKYAESVALESGVVLLGGYDGSFTTRNPTANRTMIYGGGVSSPITSGPGVDAAASVDGFVLTGAGGVPGAAVSITGGAPVVRNNEISGNILGGIAGGIYITNGSTARIQDNRILDNVTQGSGGGIRTDESSPTIVGNTIERNVSRHSGGGIHAVGGGPAITQNVLRENRAGDGGGGGAHLQDTNSSTSISGNDFLDNRAEYGAGVLMKDGSRASYTDNDFSGNVAAVAGGGLAIFSRCEATLVSNRFTNCIAETNHGGGIYVFDAEVDVTGSDPTGPAPDASFVGCTAKLNGGGFYAFESTGVLSGVRFQNCTADSSGGGVHVARCLYTISENLVVDCTALEAGGIGVLFNGGPPLLQCQVLSNTIYGCAATGGSQFGGGMTAMGNGQDNVALIAGNLITHTREGSALRCKRAPPGPTQTARPTILCSTFHLDAANTTPPGDTVGGTFCQEPFSTDQSNRIGDPLYCSAASGDFALQNCSPDFHASCKPAGTPGSDNRGASADFCGCGLTSLDEASWGRIKASYR